MLRRFLHEDKGQDMVEYALLAAFISIVAIIAIKAVGDEVIAVFNKIATELAT